LLYDRFEFSKHAMDAVLERNIPKEWIFRTIDEPDYTEEGLDDNIHYIKAISEYGGRFLRVVINPNVFPERIVTVFFDRRLKRRRT
jgi:hypothetical protein